MIFLYWDIGRGIVEKQQEHGWGDWVVELIAEDLKRSFPGAKGFSTASIWRMRQFYLVHNEREFLAQVVRDFVAVVPWGHHVLMLGRMKSVESALSTFNCQIVLVLIHTGKAELAIHATRQVDDLLNELNDAPEIATFHKLGQERVYAMMYHAVLVQRLIELKLAQAIKALEKRSGKRYGVLVHGNRLLASIVFARLKIGQKLADTKFVASDYDGTIEKELWQAVDVITTELSQRFAESFPAVVFKNPTKSKALFDNSIAAPQSDQLTLL